ncbi:alpha/beta hydrolase [Marinobacterium sp. D7]|uniref:alpha/beta fold hydrolase n=1 Tax=Marinobacterium ramblicola TaxID=2849041 RepID=UPI001C2D8583|nr:alpha/beta hydrolase [Marinobacterium ramblicola]MBV1788415.1 alpha/beta hydrolase [Marinobacterium ramblicola]
MTQIPISTLMLLPGLLCDEAVWQEQITDLRDLECRVVDYGAADSIGAMADIVLQQAPARFALAGHSMGGRVALEVYRRAPARVERIALLDTGYEARPAGAAGEPERQKRLALLEQAQREGMRAMGAVWAQGMVHPDRLRDRELMESILEMIARKTPELFHAQIRALLERPDATPVLQSLHCPTLLLVGRQDSWSPLERHEAMAELAPAAVLRVIEDAGHMSTMERPRAVTVALREWLGL